jgi:hypothetical protein
MKTLFEELPDPPEPEPAPPWMVEGRACWARFGNQGWSPGVILRVRLKSQTCLIEMVGREFKPWTQHGQPRGVRPFDRMAPRDPAAKGKDRPPKPDSPQAVGWGAGPN